MGSPRAAPDLDHSLARKMFETCDRLIALAAYSRRMGGSWWSRRKGSHRCLAAAQAMIWPVHNRTALAIKKEVVALINLRGEIGDPVHMLARSGTSRRMRRGSVHAGGRARQARLRLERAGLTGRPSRPRSQGSAVIGAAHLLAAAHLLGPFLDERWRPEARTYNRHCPRRGDHQCASRRASASASRVRKITSGASALG